MTRRDMAHRGLPLAYVPDRPLYEDDLSDLTWPELVKIAAGVFFLLLLMVVVVFAISLVGPQ